MANDRVFLRCDKCGDADLLCLYTMMGAGLYPGADVMTEPGNARLIESAK